MPLTGALAKAMTYWGAIQASVAQRATTAELFSAIRGAAGLAPGESLGVSASVISQLRGMAAGIRNASEALGSAAPDQAIGPSMISGVPWGRSQAQQDLVGIWQVRFLQDVSTEEGTQQVWRTTLFQGVLPATVGSLFGQLDDVADTMASSYGQGNLGYSQVSIIAT